MTTLNALGAKVIKKKIVFGLFVLCIIIAVAVAIFVFSRTMCFDFSEDENIRIWLDSDEASIDNFAAIPSGESAMIQIAPSSSEYQKLLPVLNSLRYSNCVHTIIADWFPPNERTGLLRLSVLDADFYITQSSQHILIDKRLFRITNPEHLYQSIIEVILE
ncbi:MAG: hypothetical protein GX939_00060 [Clostridiaceae bacterium]|jgi:hypothetical protein|nr:hypothetical protein [Clostridiaceae bacterium]